MLLIEENSKNPIVSIIIPVYNISQYIEKCLISCINQTFKAIEIIVVNDGSTDNSLELIQSYAGNDDRIIVINKQNEGLYRARKSGIEQSSGEYIFHLDGDDYIAENAIEVLYIYAIQNRADIVCSGSCIDTNGIIEFPDFLFEEGCIDVDNYLQTIIDNYSFNIWGKLIKRDLLNDFYHTDLPLPIGEDLFQTIQISSKVDIIWNLNMYLYYYVQRPFSIMHNQNILERAEQELYCAMAIDDLISHFLFTQLVLNKLRYVALDKICYFLRISGNYGRHKYWIRKSIDSFLFKQSSFFYVFGKNKKIFFMILIQYLSPSLARLLSNIVRKNEY